jgi:histidinol dehydrogenase
MRISRFDWDGRDPTGLAAELRSLQPPLAEVAEGVADLIAQVAERGDQAVLELDARFSGIRRDSLRVPEEAVSRALAASGELEGALRYASEQIRAVAEAEAAAESDSETTGEAGQWIGMRSVPVGAAGAYVPGGTASYPSSALMCCIPAKAAGVERVAVASPPGAEGAPDSAVLAACAVAGADEVYAMGGVQAIAALALGTETVRPADVVVGPGNRYVQEAKRQLFGKVGIDGIAGPSELMVIVDDGTDPRWAALDLCAQAEHGPDGLLVAATAQRHLLDPLEVAVRKLVDAPDSSVDDAPLALVAAPGNAAAIELANALAPEHLQLALDDAEELAAGVETAGCVFVGPAAGTAYGDFAAGSNHVLPTGGAGRFMGPLGPRAFRRRIATVRISPEAAAELAPAAATLAGAEGFPVHSESVTARSGRSEGQEIR